MTKCDCEDDNVECHVCHDGEDIGHQDYKTVYRNQYADCDEGEEVFECKCGKNYHRSWTVGDGGAGGERWID